MAILRSADGKFYDVDDNVLSGKEVKPENVPQEAQGGVRILFQGICTRQVVQTHGPVLVELRGFLIARLLQTVVLLDQ